MRRGLIAGAALLVAFALPSAAAGSAGPGQLLDEARQQLGRGDAIAAEVTLKKAQAEGASRESVAALIGWALLRQDQPERARRWLASEDFSRETALEGYRALAIMLIQTDDLVAAGRAYDKALAVAPNDATLWTDIARLRYRGGEHVSAIKASDRALRLDPQNVRALELRGQLVRDRDGLVPSLRWFELAHERAPQDISVLGELAATVGETGEAKRMLELTRAMLKIDPDNARAYYLQAVLAARAGKFRLGRVLMNKTRGQLKDVPAAMLLEGVLELEAGNYTLAVEALDPLVRAQPGNSKARDLLARALFLAGEHKYLIETMGDAARAGDATPYLKVLLARSYAALGHPGKGTVLLDEAAREEPTQVHAVSQGSKVGVLLARGRSGEAQAVVAGWLAQNDGYYDTLAAAGDVQLARGNPRGAMAWYARAARIRMPESLMTRRFHAMIDAGETGQAARLVESYLAANPNSGAAMRLAGWTAGWSGNWPRARLLLETARINGGSRDVLLLSDLAVAQLRSGAPEAAVITAREAYSLQRANPQAAQTLGLVLAETGQDKATARALLAKARAILGDSPMLAEGRRRLGDEV